MKKSERVKFILCFSDKISLLEISWLISCRKFDNLQHKQRSSLTEDFLATAVCTMWRVCSVVHADLVLIQD